MFIPMFENDVIWYGTQTNTMVQLVQEGLRMM